LTVSPSTRIVIVCGPTGSGKTNFAIDLAQNLSAEIVGADSMQIYRYMDIGTAKPTLEEQVAVPHHLIDVVEPDTSFNATCYIQMADKAIEGILKRGKMPLIVGGTGLYIKALLHGLFRAPKVNHEVRQKLKEELEIKSHKNLHRYLKKVDPISATRINVHDTQRLIRAIEFFKSTGQPISLAQRAHRFDLQRYQAIKIGLKMERKALYRQINLRVDAMLDEGLLDEVKKLLEMGCQPKIKSMQALGYRHMIHFIMGKLSFDEAVRTLKRDHRRYAKRQMTWFGADKDIHWLLPDQKSTALKLIQDFFHSNRFYKEKI
jgi:tRNA dimethylallyltransferase